MLMSRQRMLKVVRRFEVKKTIFQNRIFKDAQIPLTDTTHETDNPSDPGFPHVLHTQTPV